MSDNTSIIQRDDAVIYTIRPNSAKENAKYRMNRGVIWKGKHETDCISFTWCLRRRRDGIWLKIVFQHHLETNFAHSTVEIIEEDYYYARGLWLLPTSYKYERFAIKKKKEEEKDLLDYSRSIEEIIDGLDIFPILRSE